MYITIKFIYIAKPEKSISVHQNETFGNYFNQPY